MKLPAYYIFINDELNKLVELRPKTIEELQMDFENLKDNQKVLLKNIF